MVKRFRNLVVGGLLIVGLVVGFGLYLDTRLEQPVAVSSLEVPLGTPANQILAILAPSMSQTERALIFRLHPEFSALQAGRYAFVTDMSVRDALRAIQIGDAVTSRLTIPEGIRASDLFTRMMQSAELTGGVPDQQQLTSVLQPGFTHPEGAFLAETYIWKPPMERGRFLELAHLALVEALDDAWSNRADSVDQVLSSPYELLILASIVEKETAVAEERPRVAGVFIERLRIGMRLQTDPTVIYGLGDAFDGNLTRQHLRQTTAYNTYRINGLPPTPIALVGPEALQAVSQPNITGELYFVADGEGAHVFSRTLQEHNAAVRKYQLKR
jgi:UPF0755 protein